MEKSEKTINPVCYTPSSEPLRLYQFYLIYLLICMKLKENYVDSVQKVSLHKELVHC
jgi:hypothetical protein